MTKEKSATKKAISPKKEVAKAAPKKVSKFLVGKYHFGMPILNSGLLITDERCQYKTLDGCTYTCTKAEYDALK